MVPTAQRYPVRTAQTDLFWVEMGSGPPLVLLHGLTDSHRTWSRVAARLAQTHRVLMPDLPGHGLSGRPDAPYSLEWNAQAISEWLDALGIDRYDIVGHSYGGGVAQNLVLLHRERIRRLALVSAGGLGRAVHWSLRLASLPHVVEQAGQPWMAMGTRVAMRVMNARFDPNDVETLSVMNAAPGSARAFARTVRDVIDLRGQRKGFFDRAHEIPELPPMALIWGDRDSLIPVSHATEFAARVEGVQVTRFAECGHFPHREAPEAFTRALRGFLAAESLPAARIVPPKAPESPGAPMRHRERLRAMLPRAVAGPALAALRTPRAAR